MRGSEGICHQNGERPPPAATGPIYAALLALKPTFALFVALHLLACTGADALSSRRIGATVRRALATTGWSLAFLAPWLALYLPLYWTAVTAPVVSMVEAPVPAVRSIDLLSTATLFYGGSYAAYALAAVAPPICGVAVLIRGERGSPDALRFAAICATVPIAYLFMLLVMGPLLAGYGTALRHFLPVLIGVVPAALATCGLLARSDTASRRLGGTAGVGLGLAAVLAVGFAPHLWTRISEWRRVGTMPSYVRHWPQESTSALLKASSEMLQPAGPLASKLAGYQRLVPAGEPLLAWITAPFLLDFARNPIIDVDIGGLANPWSQAPPVKYVIWQYDGFGVRLPDHYERQMRGQGRRETYLAARGLAYFQHLEQLMSRGQVLMDDGSTVVLRIQQ